MSFILRVTYYSADEVQGYWYNKEDASYTSDSGKVFKYTRVSRCTNTSCPTHSHATRTMDGGLYKGVFELEPNYPIEEYFVHIAMDLANESRPVIIGTGVNRFGKFQFNCLPRDPDSSRFSSPLIEKTYLKRTRMRRVICRTTQSLVQLSERQRLARVIHSIYHDRELALEQDILQGKYTLRTLREHLKQTAPHRLEEFEQKLLLSYMGEYYRQTRRKFQQKEQLLNNKCRLITKEIRQEFIRIGLLTFRISKTKKMELSETVTYDNVASTIETLHRLPPCGVYKNHTGRIVDIKFDEISDQLYIDLKLRYANDEEDDDDE